MRRCGRDTVITQLPIALALILVGCATTDTFWAKPDLTPATKADMSRRDQDVYDCVRESRQKLGFGELQSSVERNAQRLYVLCMRARGYTVPDAK
jgi:hypothetical protein